MGEGREIQEGGDLCIIMAGSHCCRQKATQHCKAIVLQIKKQQQQAFGYDLNLILLSDNMENGLVMGKTDLGKLIKRLLRE